MILGHVRDFLPRVSLTLPGHDGRPVVVEFIVDTAFEGDLAMPSSLLTQLNATFIRDRVLRLADGSEQVYPFYEILLDWHDGPRLVEIAVLENAPLLGAVLLDGSHVSLDMTDGGEVAIEER